MTLSPGGEKKARKIRKRIMRDLEGGNRMRNHWFMIILFVFAMQCLDYFVFDRISKASKKMMEVQEIVKPDTAEVDTLEIYDHLDFFIDKLSKIVRIMYDRGLITWEDSQALQEIDQKWLNQQCYEIMKEIEEEIEKEE